jgi:hypothetical protein
MKRWLLTFLLLTAVGCKSVQKNFSKTEFERTELNLSVDTTKIKENILSTFDLKEFDWKIETFQRFDSAGTTIFKPITINKKWKEETATTKATRDEIRGSGEQETVSEVQRHENKEVRREVSLKWVVGILLFIGLILFIVGKKLRYF